MAGSWGSSWGSSWVGSWGFLAVVGSRDDGGIRPRRRHKLRPEDIIAIVEAIQSAEEKPKPAAKKRKALVRKIVETVTDDIFEPARRPVTEFVRQEVKREAPQLYQPGVSWAEIHATITRMIEAARAEAQRIEQEIEEEDEMIFLMVA